MEKKTVAILYGGRSVEHGVSINSARNIFEFIDKERFQPLAIGLSKSGQWFLTDQVSKDIEQGIPVSFPTDPREKGFTAQNKTYHPNLVFPVLHGTDGEDGSVQGLLTALQIPFVGSGVLGSALAMNKIIAKQLLQLAGLPVAPFVYFTHRERDQIDFSSLKEKFGLPFMVKSASLGSSVGVSKVDTIEKFNAALEDSFRYDDEIIIEKYIKGREIECAILGNDPAEASNPGEIIISERYDFYSFDAKYVDPEAVKIQVPAGIPNHLTEQIKSASIRAFNILRCQDFARVDLFVTDDKILVNEINTIPGFTNSSMFPMMWKERGISFTDLISRLLDIADQRAVRQNRINRDFNSALKF
jgi:D-alanine-D-alanine ligase